MAAIGVVTGASRGIGRATALALARRGLSLGLLGRPSPALEQTQNEVEALGVQALVCHCDLGVPVEVESAAATLLRALGTPQVVVNNAAEARRGRTVAELPVAEWDRILAVNLRGPFVLCRALLPAMLAARQGRFVHVASISATIGCAGMADYAASKWGLLGLSKSLAEELRGTGLQSLAVLPGSVDTDMLKGSSFEPRMQPEQVAALVTYLALDAPEAMTGAAVEMFG